MTATAKKMSAEIPLNASSINAALGASSADFSLHVFDQLDSTNTFLMQQAAAHARHATCVVAQSQTAGRGRHGRSWASAAGGSLTFSLLWRFSLPLQRLEGLSLAVGVALVRALRESGMHGAELKWPNDVLHHFHKLAGVLIETGSEPDGKSYAVIGVGININLPDETRDEIDQAVTDWMSIMQTSIDRNILLARLLRHFAVVLNQFELGGLNPLRVEWMNYHAYQNKHVRLRWPDTSEVFGCVNGIADNGALLLQTSQGEKAYSVGEISLRAMETR